MILLIDGWGQSITVLDKGLAWKRADIDRPGWSPGGDDLGLSTQGYRPTGKAWRLVLSGGGGEHEPELLFVGVMLSPALGGLVSGH